MNQKEAIELALEMNAECEKCDGCKGCPFLLEDADGYQEAFCSIAAIEDIGIERLKERLRQLDSSYVPSDNVNSPSHYCKGGLECIEAIRAACEDLMAWKRIKLAMCLKYIWRFKGKNGVEDLRKARNYLDWLIEQEEKNAGTL